MAGDVVPGPPAREHPALPLHHPAASRLVGQKSGRLGQAQQLDHVDIMPRVAIGGGRVRGAMVLRMQDGRLFPESARQLQRRDLARPIGESAGEVSASRASPGSGLWAAGRQRPQFQLDFTAQIVETRPDARRVLEIDDGGFASASSLVRSHAPFAGGPGDGRSPFQQRSTTTCALLAAPGCISSTAASRRAAACAAKAAESAPTNPGNRDRSMSSEKRSITPIDLGQ